MLHSAASPQRILVFGSSVFEEGIAHLLTRGFNFQIACSRYINELAFVDEIAQSRPDVVLLNDTIPLDKPHIFNLLFSIPTLAGLRIIVTRLSNNTIDIYMMPKQTVAKSGYERHQFNVTNRSEFMGVVQG